MSNRRFVDVALFKRLRALLLSLPQTDEVTKLVAKCEKALGKGRVKRKANDERCKCDGVLRDDQSV